MSAWRWVVERNMGTYDFAYTREDYAPRIGIVVPVVPCDDLAIERAIEAAMDAIAESNDVIPDGQEPAPGWALKLAERAIHAGFRAAGETP